MPSHDDWLAEADPDDEWIPSDDEGIYFRDEQANSAMSGYGPSSARTCARQMREALGDHVTVVISAGPYRSHNVRYRYDEDTDRLHLDYYSVRPGFDRTEDIIEDIREAGVATPE